MNGEQLQACPMRSNRFACALKPLLQTNVESIRVQTVQNEQTADDLIASKTLKDLATQYAVVKQSLSDPLKSSRVKVEQRLHENRRVGLYGWV
jgi:hypothetical protein